MTLLTEEKNKQFEEELNRLDKEEERMKQERLEEFISAKKKREKEWENILMVKKKNRLIRTEVNEENKEQMEKILADRDHVFDNFDTLYQLNPKNTIHFCGKLLVKPTAEEI